MKTLNFIKSAVASEISQLPKMSFDCRSNVENELLESIESNGYCQPSEIGTTAEAWDLVWSEMARKLDYEKPDFSSCSSALECAELEGQAILDAAYYEATQEICKDIASAIGEIFNHNFGDKEVLEIMIGKAGMGHIPHNEEVDIADSSLIVWDSRIQINIEGVMLYGILTEIEQD